MSYLAPISPDLVWFSGPDAVGFLNDLVSQEIEDMATGTVRRSLLLGNRGKLDHLLWVLKASELVGLVTDSGRGEELAATLTRYRIRVKVDIEQETRPLWVVFDGVIDGVWSNDRRGTLDADISWHTTSRRLLAGPRPELPLMPDDEHHAARVRAGEPSWGVDVDEKTIPQETGMVEETVDFGKGCYLGQELVARIHSRGHVNRYLRHLELSAPVTPGTVITAEDREVGLVTSVAGRLGLGMVRREIEPGDQVNVGEETAVVLALPWSQ